MLVSTVPSPSHYVNWGFRPTPLAAGMKFPRLKGWPTRAVTPDEWQPGEGIGLVCGLQPDGSYLICLDFDHRPEQGIDAPANYERFMDSLGMDLESKVFVTRSTSGNGRHVYIKLPREVKKGKLTHDGVTIGDLLGTGAQVVAQPPARWEWRRPYRLELLTDAETDTLLNLIKYQPEPEKPVYVAPAQPTVRVRPGDDFNARGRQILIDTLLNHGWTIKHQVGNEVQFCRPGKHGEVSASLDHIDGLFHVFTSSVECFEIDSNHSYFGAYGLLAHGGNFRAAAAELAKQGFGDPITDREGIRQKAWLAGSTPERSAGRPKSVDAVHLYNVIVELADCNTSAVTNAELAERLGRSERTIRRWLDALEQDGLITRRQTSTGRWIDIVGADNNSPRVRARIEEDTKTLNSGGVWGGEPDVRPVESTFAICETCTIGELALDESGITRCSYCEQAIPLASLVNEATLTYEHVRGPAQRLELVKQYVASNGRPDVEPEQIERVNTSIVAARRQARSDEKYAAKLRDLSERKLAARERSAVLRAEEFKAAGKRGQEYIWRRMIHLINQEQKRREPIRARLKPQRQNLFGEVVF